VARGLGLHVSLKEAMYVSRFIKKKKIDDAISDLRQVIMLKRAVPYKGEIPHRKGPMMSGRYPLNASKAFIQVLKALKGNVIVNGMELENTYITLANPSWAYRPLRKGGRVEGKRINLILQARENPEAKKNG